MVCCVTLLVVASCNDSGSGMYVVLLCWLLKVMMIQTTKTLQINAAKWNEKYFSLGEMQRNGMKNIFHYVGSVPSLR